MDFFRLSTAALAVLLIAVLAGSVAIGVLAGRAMRDRPGTRHETAGVVQGALLGLVGLLLAFGLSMAVGTVRITACARRAGGQRHRHHLPPRPTAGRAREQPVDATLLKDYTDAAIEVADAVPGTGPYREAVANVERLQGDLWTLATDAVSADPVGTGPRLYTETLNNMFDTHTSRVASLGNRVPTPVMILLVLGSAVAVGVLAFYLTLLGKGLATSLITAAVVLIILFVSFDLDRPQRGFIQVPDAALVQLRDSFDQP